jgi:hypothetical protein
MLRQTTARRRRFTVAAILLCLCAGMTTRADEASPGVRTEYDIKAAFLYKFALFVEWPAGTFAAGDSPFTIGILGDDPFGPRLEAVVGGKKVRGRPIRFRRFAAIEEALPGSCHLLFVSASERDRVNRIVAALATSAILTVGDTADYTAAGVAINLFVRDRNMRFAINKAAAERSGLRISSQLLDLAVAPEESKSRGGAP